MLEVLLLAIRDEDDRQLVHDLFAVYEKKLYRIAFKVLKNREDSEDCVIDVIIAIIDHLERFKELSDSEGKRFLVKCCKNIAIDKYRKNKRQRAAEDSSEISVPIADVYEDVAKTIIMEENYNSICEMIQCLPARYSDILYFRYVIGMSCADIAQMLDITRDAVYLRISRGKKKLLKKGGADINEILALH